MIPRIGIELDTKGAEALLARSRRQLPYAAALAINRTGEEVVAVQREHMRRVFTIRRPWVLNQVRLAQRASKESLEALVITTPQARFLTKFEAGGVRRGLTDRVILPTTAGTRYGPPLRPSKEAIIPAGFYPKALRLAARKDVVGTLGARTKTSARGVTQWLGQRRTFILDPATYYGVATWAIYQRTGPGTIRMLWVGRRSVKIPASLHFMENARRTVAERMPVNFHGFFEEAMRTAR